MGNLKITIIGNSVELRVKSPENHPDNINCNQYLEEILQEKISDRTAIVKNKYRSAEKTS